MKAVLPLDKRHVVAANAFVELVVWRLGTRLPGSWHDFRYRLALVVDGRCILRYDATVIGRFLERSGPMEVLTCGR